MYQKSHGKFIKFFFELPTFDPAKKLQILIEFHKQKNRRFPSKLKKCHFEDPRLLV